MGTHMVVPALPLISADLAVAPSATQQVVSFYLFGLAGGQLLVGPAIDRLGRRKVLIAGLILYVLAAMLGTFAEGMPSLLWARVLQAIGASAGLVTSRVIVGDLFERSEAGRSQATLMSVVLLSPAIAPVMGGLIAGTGGWRPIMALLAIVGVTVLVGSVRFIPESAPPSRSGVRRHLLQDYSILVRNSRFIRISVAMAGLSSALFMFLAVAPFLLITQWGLDTEQAGLCFLATAVAGIIGSQSVGWIEKRANALLVGLICSFVGSIVAFLLALGGAEGPAVLIGPIMIMTVGVGIAAPAGIAVIVHAEEGLSGTATSLAGAMQMMVAGSASTLLGWIGPPSLLLLGAGMLCANLFALIVLPRSKSAV